MRQMTRTGRTAGAPPVHDPFVARTIPPLRAVKLPVQPPLQTQAQMTRPPEPLPRRDPAPSRWRYRLSRLMLTPLFRAFLRVGLPAFAALFVVGAWFSSDENRQKLTDTVADLRMQIEQRPEFSVRMMAIDGADEALMADIRKVVALDFPISSFDIDLEAEREKIAALNAVKTAAVRVRPGGVLQVEVAQRVPVAVWRDSDGLKLIDESGAFVAPIEARADRADLPLIVGDGARAALDEARTLYAAAAPLEERMRGLVRMGERRWDVVLDRGQRILLPARNPLRALERVIALDLAKEMLARDIALVDMRNPDRPTVRMNVAAADAFRIPVGAETN